MFVLRINKIRTRGLGEVALRCKSISGGYTDQKTRLCLPGEIPEGFIVSFEEHGGNGCILKKLKNPVYIPELSQFGIAIVVTAAHVICDPITGYFESVEVYCEINGISMPLQCFPLKSLLKTVTECEICTTGYKYCLNEGDLAILLLLSPVSSININEIEIEQSKVSEGTDCFLSGKPFGMLTRLSYNYPYVQNFEEVRRRMHYVFHNPSQLIISEGIITSSEEFLELSCSNVLVFPDLL